MVETRSADKAKNSRDVSGNADQSTVPRIADVHSENNIPRLCNKPSGSNTLNSAALAKSNMAPGNEQPAQATVTRLPPFNKSDPDLWFNQVERILSRNNIIEEEDKADVLIATVDSDILTCVRCVVLQRPAPADIYTQIKNGIRANFGLSDEHRLRQLIEGEVLSSKPSFILNQMRNIANGQCSDEVLRSLFMEHLPTLHRQILAPSSTKNLAELAQIADKITDEMQGSSQASPLNVAAVETSNSALERKIDALVTELASMKEKLNKMNKSSNSFRGRSRDRSRSRGNRSRSRNENRQKSDMCWYHTKFGDKTIPSKCIPPCNYNQKQNSGNV